MSSSTSLTPQQVNAVSWTFGAVAVALSVGRYFIRWKVIGRFHLDDIAHFAAVLFMIAELVCYVVFTSMNDAFVEYEKGEIPAEPAVFQTIETLSAVLHILFYCAIWSVKIAFLLFYRTLFNISKRFSTAWWAVLAYNVVTFWVCLAGVFIQCGGSITHLTDYTVCESAISIPWIRKIYIFTYVAVVTSDLATMILPLAMLRGLQMRRSQKYAIGLLFSLSFIAIFFDTLRLVKSILGGNELNVLWYQLEETFAVIISAIPSYYSLMTWSKLRTTRPSNRYYDFRSGSKSSGSHNLSSQGSGRIGSQDGITRTYEIHMDAVNRV